MKHLTSFLFATFLFWTWTASAQCDTYVVSGSQTFHANDIRTVINTGGDMFWDLNDSRFQVPYTGSETPSAIFAAAVWIGGYDDVGNLKLAAQTYRSGINSQEYQPGPLTTVGTQFSDDCADWDQIWSVTRNEILLHLEDFEADGVIDNPQASIFSWPGIGNAHFETLNGFPMPDYSQGYAPFYDKDLDGEYEPDEGEYPLPQDLASDVIPDQITWHVFNDVRLHRVTQADPVRAEIQQTCYAFYCTGNDVLNSTMFMDFNVINRNTAIMDSLYFAIWMDADLGCYTDDYIGSAPFHDAFIVYNEDSVDGTNGNDCNQGVLSYATPPPVLSGRFLNRDMTSFMVYANSSVGQNPSPTTDPGVPLEFYRLMSGSWIDGSPLCFGGIGYDPGPGCLPTDFAFPGDPNDSLSWAMINEDITQGDRRFIISTYLERLDPGESTSVSMSFSLHLDLERDHLGNATVAYEQLPYLKEKYDLGFDDCLKSLEPCDSECVWPGDANNDGIANHMDLLNLGLASSGSGPLRMAPLSWAPHGADAWTGSLPDGLNMKYTDMNGDGEVDIEDDIDILNLHYGLTHDGYQEQHVCEEGAELLVDGGFELFNPSTFRTRTTTRLNADLVDSLYGLAFTVLFDTAYFTEATSISASAPFPAGESQVIHAALPGKIEYAMTKWNHQNGAVTFNDDILGCLFRYNNKNLIPNQPDTTEVCIANIRGILADGTEVPMGSNRIQFIFLEEEPSSLEETLSEEILVYPNPAGGRFSVVVPEALVGDHYEIFTPAGTVIRTGILHGEVTEVTMPSGVYALIVRGSGAYVVKKVVVTGR